MTIRLPIPGSDDGTWGSLLNDFLSQAHETDGSLKASTVKATTIQDGTIPSTKLDTATQSAITKANGSIQTINSKSGSAVTLDGSDIAYDASASTIITHNNIQGALQDLDTAVAGGGSSFAPSAVKIFQEASQTGTTNLITWGTSTQLIIGDVSADIDPSDHHYIKFLKSGVFSITWSLDAANGTTTTWLAQFYIQTGDWMAQNTFQQWGASGDGVSVVFSRTVPIKVGDRIALQVGSTDRTTPFTAGDGKIDITRIMPLI